MALAYFEPSAGRARECRRALDDTLWSSAKVLLAEGLPQRDGQTAADIADSRSAIALDYGAYSDIQIAHPSEGELPADVKAEAWDYLLKRMTGPRNALTVQGTPATESGLPRISTLSEESYSLAEIETFRRWWDIEPQNALGLTAVPDDRLENTRRQISLSFELMQQCAPELHRETLEIVHDIIVATPGAPQGLDLGGVSSFALWGAFAINPDTQDVDGWVHYFKTIVHEAGHSLLFAFARSEPLVQNHPDETYSSPVRPDLRPMDGIFHAAFVSAREAYALDRLLSWHEKTERLSAREVELAEGFFEDGVIAFWQCSEILRRDARLTPLGNTILRECERFMREEFTLVTS